MNNLAEKYHNFNNIVGNYDKLSAKDIAEILARTSFTSEQRECTVKLLGMKLQEDFQVKMLRKQNFMVVATWVLAVAAIFALLFA
ncbi:MAG: hypothetical protein ABIH35_04360 [Patescibacteria group bacterium]